METSETYSPVQAGRAEGASLITLGSSGEGLTISGGRGLEFAPVAFADTLFLPCAGRWTQKTPVPDGACRRSRPCLRGSVRGHPRRTAVSSARAAARDLVRFPSLCTPDVFVGEKLLTRRPPQSPLRRTRERDSATTLPLHCRPRRQRARRECRTPPQSEFETP